MYYSIPEQVSVHCCPVPNHLDITDLLGNTEANRANGVSYRSLLCCTIDF